MSHGMNRDRYVVKYKERLCSLIQSNVNAATQKCDFIGELVVIRVWTDAATQNTRASFLNTYL